jgi:hypothetical protein
MTERKVPVAFWQGNFSCAERIVGFGKFGTFGRTPTRYLNLFLLFKYTAVEHDGTVRDQSYWT